MKDYYAILGISKSSSATTIRDAYRKLAKQFHPDVNKDAYAEQYFKEVNEAYEILGDPEKRAQYDQPFIEYAVESPAPAPRHRDRAYHRQPPPSDYESDSQRLKRLSEEYKIYFVWFCRVGLAFSVLLGLDRILPTAFSEQTVVEVEVERYRRAISYHLITDRGRKIVLDPVDFSHLGDMAKDGTIALELTMLFSTVVSIQGGLGEPSIWVEKLYTSLSFFPIILFLASLVGELFKWKTEVALNCGTISLVMTVITLVMLVY